MSRMHARKTVLALAARTATTNSPSQTNYWSKGAIIIVDVTASAATPNISTVAVQAATPSGNWATVASWTGQTITGASRNLYLLYPAAASAGGYTDTPVEGVLPVEYRIALTHDDGDSITYSVEVQEIL